MSNQPTFTPLTEEEVRALPTENLTRELDKTKTSIFLGSNSAFLASLMSSMDFVWSYDIPTAATNGETFWWNPMFFLNLDKKTRETVLAHELWHAGLLHMVRRGDRDPEIWNYACVAKGTRIAMADGSSKPIQTIIPGDQILNVENGTSVVAQRINSGKKNILEIEMENGAILRCTQEHKVLTTNGFKTASQLAVGTTCFVDTRHGGIPQEELGQYADTADCGPFRNEIPTSGVQSLHSGSNSISEANTPEYSNAAVIECGMGVPSGSDRRGRNDFHRQQNDERKAVPQASLSCDQYLSENARLAYKSRFLFNSSREPEGMLVFYHEYPEHSPERLFEETRTVASHEAAFSNASASMDRDPGRASLQVLTNARNAVNSREHPELEYNRIREIRQLDAEDCFDLVTSDHHYIANGVVVHNCDIRINNGLENDGFSFRGVEDCWKDQTYGLQAEEDIYDALCQQTKQVTTPAWGSGPCTPNGSGGQGQPNLPGDQGQPGQSGSQDPGQIGDMVPTSAASNAAAVNNVIRATHQAKMAGQPGSIPGGLEEIIDKFLKPVIPWEEKLQRWMKDLLEEDYTWARPNRRFTDIYLPSRFQEEGRLEHLVYFQDTSGSMTPDELLRTNSEIKYVWDTLRPKKLTTVQFDTKIQKIDEFVDGDQYDSMVVNGRGGTNLQCVRNYIIKERPTAAVIFSDLYVSPMEELPFDIPILWATATKGATVPFGELIQIRES